jgi:hypothetical protein
MAERHVTEACRAVARQRKMVARKRKLGFDITESERLLQNLESSLAIFEDDLRAVLRGASSPISPFSPPSAEAVSKRNSPGHRSMLAGAIEEGD